MTLKLSDGSVRDVTGLCRFDVEPNTIAESTPGGVVLPKADGLGTLRVMYGDQTAHIGLRVQRMDRSRRPGFRTDVVPLLSKAGCNMGLLATAI